MTLYGKWVTGLVDHKKKTKGWITTDQHNERGNWISQVSSHN